MHPYKIAMQESVRRLNCREYLFLWLWRVREWYGKFTAAFEMKLLPQGKLKDNFDSGVPAK